MNQWPTPPLLGRLIANTKIPIAVLAAAVVVGYWGILFVVCVFSNTVISVETGDKLFGAVANVIPKETVYRDYMANQAINNGVSYFDDISHHVFTLALVGGAVFISLFIRKINTALKTLRITNILCGDGRESEVIERYSKHIGKIYFYLLPMIFSAYAFSFFMDIYYSNETQLWWGNVRYGYGGLLFSLIIFSMVFAGTYYIQYVLLASTMLGKLMSNDIAPELFHEDGCNGLEPLGVLIVYLWGFAISLALAVYVTVHFGYLGLEARAFVWIIALFATFSIPFVAIYPLFMSLRSMYRYRRTKLKMAKTLLLRELSQIEKSVEEEGGVGSLTQLEGFEKLAILYESIHGINLWPFDVRVLLGAVIIYFLQALVIIIKIISDFKIALT